MSANDFCEWLVFMKLSDAGAQRALGIGSRNTLIRYKTDGAPEYIGLACAALAFGLPSWKVPAWAG